MKKTILFFSFLGAVSCGGPSPLPTDPAPLFTDYVTTIPKPAETLAPGVKPTYEVEVEDQDGVETVTVRFTGTLPAPEVVDKILRDEFKKVVKLNPKNDAFGYACSENNICLTENQYSGDLAYKAGQKKIITADEANGITAFGKDNGSYYVLTQEISPPPNFTTPVKPLLVLRLVFPEPPRQRAAYEAMIAEIEKVRDRHLGVLVFVEAGDRNKKTSWYRVKGSDGEIISANYLPELDTILTKTVTVLKKF